MRTHRAWAVILSGTLTACSVWHLREALPAEPLPTRERVQIWVGTTAHAVHGVVVRGDSLTAVPVWKPPTCDSCRITFALAEVDSIRAESVAGETVLIAGALVATAVILTVLNGLKSLYP